MASPQHVSHRFDSVTWASSAMRNVEADIACAVLCDLNVLITGEAGVGKRSIAERIHRESERGAAPFAVARIAEEADQVDSIGDAFNQVSPGGTLLIDRADRLVPAGQLHLQRCLERDADRYRSSRYATRRKVRLLTTASSDLLSAVVLGTFSERLFYHLNAVHLMVPPLREHPEDIPVLLQHFLRLYGRLPVPRLSMAARNRLVMHAWPGNVWELRAVAWTLASREVAHPDLQPGDLPPGIGQ
jgi:DNA-binding NtrC family response regulator